MTNTDKDTLIGQLQIAAGDQEKFVAIIVAVGREDLSPKRWAEEIRFETNLAANRLSRSAVALQALELSPAGDTDLDVYLTRINRACPLKHYPAI